jgi:hypothetical protein
MTTRLPLLLDDLRIATPCRADWDEMQGDDRVRFCGQCEKNVYNLSAMPRDEAEALVREKEGRLCVRFYQRQDGTVLTADCPVGVRRRRLRQRVWASVSSFAASAAMVLGLFGGRARADLAIDGKKPTQRHAAHVTAPMGGTVAPPPRLMGKVALPPKLMGEVVAPQPHKPAPALMGAPPAPKMGDVAIVKTK